MIKESSLLNIHVYIFYIVDVFKIFFWKLSYQLQIIFQVS